MSVRLVTVGKITAGSTIERIDNRFGNHPEIEAAGLLPWNPRNGSAAYFPKTDDPNHPETRGKWAEEQIALGAGEDI